MKTILKDKKNLTLLLFVVFLGISIFTIKTFLTTNAQKTEDLMNYAEENIENGEYEVKSFYSLPDKEITFLEAYNLGLKQGQKYDKKTVLVFFNSVDDGNISGGNGKKSDWQGVFSLPTVKHHMVIVIEKGKLKNYRIIDSSDELTIPNSELKIDSDQIIKTAIKEFNLQPSPKEDPFSHGYHFRLVRDKENIFFGVDGRINNQNAEIFFDTKTGKYLGGVTATEKN